MVVPYSSVNRSIHEFIAKCIVRIYDLVGRGVSLRGVSLENISLSPILPFSLCFLDAMD